MKRYVIAFGAMILLLGGLFFFNIGSGSVKMTGSEIADILLHRFGGTADETARQIVWEIRLPRICAAVILGGALSVAGFLLQSFFQNPIAGPYVLGISSGAKLVVALTMIALLEMGRAISSLGMIVAAFAGSMLAMGFVLLISCRVKKMSMLVVCGIMIGYICSAVTDLVVTFAEDADIVNLHNWSKGSFSGVTWDNVAVIAVVVFFVSVMVFFMSKPMSAYQLGEAYASNMGINIRWLRSMLVILSSILSACVTAFAGPVSFVGIAVPHLVKQLMHTSKPILMIPGCFLGGSVCCLFCDLLARTMFAPTELSISTVTAFFGAPVVIFILLRRQKERN